MTAPLRLLRWVYLGRLTLAAGIFLGAVLAWFRVTPGTTLLATILLLASIAVTLAGLWYTHLRNQAPGRYFLYSQVVFDALLVTGVVHLTGGAASDFAPLYILVIVAGALLLPLPGGVLIGALVSLLYFSAIVWLQGEPPPGKAIVQIAIFATMALVTGFLGDRLRRAGRALGIAETELRQLRLDTSDILRTIDTGVVTVDGAGRLVYLNNAAETLLDFSADEWWGRPVREELDRCAPGLGETLQNSAEQRRAVRRHELTVPAGDGEQRTIGLRTTLLDREGAPWVTAVFQDITAGKRVEELNRQTARLQGVAEFSASLAHEIRNPLASIRSAVEQLTGANPLSRQDRDVLQRLVLRESERLSSLLSEFIEYSRVELRRFEPLDLVVIVAEAADVVSQHPDRAPSVKIDFRRPDGSLRIQGDAELLHRAIFNLLLNAAQHAGPDGCIRVEIGVAPDESLPDGVNLRKPIRVAVSDSGPGITPDDMPRVFDPFFTRRSGGSGLGLAIVQRAVEAHRGTIIVDREPGAGARFTIFLPAEAAKG